VNVFLFFRMVLAVAGVCPIHTKTTPSSSRHHA
jgi:hypothetical protein